MKLIKHYISRVAVGAALVAASATALTSCQSAVYDDGDQCVSGAELRFIYDYNMEFANAFPAAVDCLTLLVYDESGTYVGTYTETTDALADENYRMRIDLPEGSYRFVAYGGMACPESSFSFNQTPAAGSQYTGRRVQLNPAALNDPALRNLHDLYFGTLDMKITEGSEFTTGTVPMMKDTNNLRVILAHQNDKPVDPNDFTFSITDDNTLFEHDNSLVPNGEVTYWPWTQGQALTSVEGRAGESAVAYAEMAFPRLHMVNAPRLHINRVSDGRKVVDIPLIDFLLLLKSERYSKMGSQEYLDRESRWSMIFFLDESSYWINTQIIINNWVVRINDADL